MQVEGGLSADAAAAAVAALAGSAAAYDAPHDEIRSADEPLPPADAAAGARYGATHGALPPRGARLPIDAQHGARRANARTPASGGGGVVVSTPLSTPLCSSP